MPVDSTTDNATDSEAASLPRQGPGTPQAARKQRVRGVSLALVAATFFGVGIPNSSFSAEAAQAPGVPGASQSTRSADVLAMAPEALKSQEVAYPEEVGSEDGTPMAAAAAAEWELVVEEQVQNTLGLPWVSKDVGLNGFFTAPNAGDYGFPATPIITAPKGEKVFIRRFTIELEFRGLTSDDLNVSSEILWIPFVVDKSHGAATGKSVALNYLPTVIPQIGRTYDFVGRDLASQKEFPMKVSIYPNLAEPSLKLHFLSVEFPNYSMGEAPEWFDGACIGLATQSNLPPGESGSFGPLHKLVVSSAPSPLVFLPNSPGRPLSEFRPQTVGQTAALEISVVHVKKAVVPTVDVGIPILSSRLADGKLVLTTADRELGAATPGTIILRQSADLIQWVEVPHVRHEARPGFVELELPASGSVGFVRAYSRR